MIRPRCYETAAPGAFVGAKPTGDLAGLGRGPEAASAAFADAEALWRGPALADLSAEPFAQAGATARV